MAVITGTTGGDSVSLTNGQANDTVDLLGGVDVLTLPDVPTALVVSNTETIIGGTDTDIVTLGSAGSVTVSEVETLVGSSGVDVVTLTTILTGNEIDLGGGSDTLQTGNSGFNLTSATLTSVEILKSTATGGATFTLDQADVPIQGSIVGGAGADILTINGLSWNLSSTTLSSIETLRVSSSLANFITLGSNSLASVTALEGDANAFDILTVNGTALDLSSTAATSINSIRAGMNADTTFTVNGADLISGGDVIGGLGSDTLAAADTALDLTSTTLTNVEILKIGGAGATTLTVDAADISGASFVLGGTGADTLVVMDTTINLASVTLSSVEIIGAGVAADTTFTVNTLDLAAGGTVAGSSGSDTLIVAATTAIDLSSTTLSSVETIKTGVSLATTFRVDQGDLASGGTVQGSTGADTLVAVATALDLTSTTLTSIEALKVGVTSGSTLTMTATQFGALTISGGSGSDTLVVQGSGTLDFSSATLSSVEGFKIGDTTATSLTVNASQLVAGGTVAGNAGSDTLSIANATAIDLSSTTISSIENLQIASGSASTLTLNQADLAAGGTVGGASGSDTLVTADTQLNLASTTLNGVVSLVAGNFGGTTFTVNQADIGGLSSLKGSSGADVIVAADTALDLSAVTLSSVEILKAALSTGTTFSVDVGFSGVTSVVGGAGSDTLAVFNTNVDLSSATLSSVEKIKAGDPGVTTFTVNQADLASGGSIEGQSTADILIAADTQLNLSSTTLSGVAELRAGLTTATIFTLDAADAPISGTVSGNAGVDTLAAAGASLDLTGTALSSIEILRAGSSAATTLAVDAADLVSGGSVLGSSGTDTLSVLDSTIDLTSTTISSIEKIAAGGVGATSFTVDAADLVSGGSVIGVGSVNDTLIVNSTVFNLASTGLSSVEILKTTKSATSFTVNQADLAAGGTIIGSGGSDTLAAADTALNLTSTTLSSIELIAAGNPAATTFTVDVADLASGVTVAGATGADALQVADSTIDLTSVTLSSVEIIKAGDTNATTFTVDAADLAANGSVIGGAGSDTLTISGATSFDLTSTGLSSVEILQGATSLDTLFKLNQADLISGGSIIGSSGTDTLAVSGSVLNLSSTTLTSVEIIRNVLATPTVFTVDQADLVSGGSVLGSTGGDTLAASGTALDLTSTTLSSVEILKSATTSGTAFTVDVSQLVSGGSVLGSTGSDALIVNTTAFDLSSTALSSVETIQAGSSLATTFKINQADLASGGSIVGSSGNDTLTVIGSSVLDLSSTSLTSVEILQAASGKATQFRVNQADLNSVTSIIGSSLTTDALIAADTQLDLSGVTISGVENLKAGTATATTFTVGASGLGSIGTVSGSSGADTLITSGTALTLTSTKISSVEILSGSDTNGVTFTVDLADMVSGGSVIGSTGTDTLILNAATSFDLSSTTLSSVEILQSNATKATTFKVNQSDLASGGTVQGGSANDILLAADTQLNLTSTTLSSVEILKAGAQATTFTIDETTFGSLSSISGAAGSDTLNIVTTSLSLIDLSSRTFSSVETIKVTTSLDTIFTIDKSDLPTGGQVIGGSGSDTLKINGTAFDLSSASISSIETLQANSAAGVKFTLDQSDIAALGTGQIIGDSSGIDTLILKSGSIDMSTLNLTDIDIIKTGNATATTFTVAQANLSSLGTSGQIQGAGGVDTLITTDTELDASSTVLSSIEILKAGNAADTVFTLNQGDLASGGSVRGSSGNDTILAIDTQMNLSSVSLSSVEILQAGSSLATTFTVDAGDLASLDSIIGSSGTDTLTVKATALDLSGVTLSSVEILRAGSATATTFTIHAADLAALSAVNGSSGADTLVVLDTGFNLAGTALSSIEILRAGLSTATTFTLDQADLGKGTIIGSSGNDTLVANGTSLDLTSTSLTSIERIQTNSGAGVKFILDQGDLASGGSITGGGGTDTLQIKGTLLDLSSTTTGSIEILRAGSATATTFTVDQADLIASGSIIGSTGADTLKATGTELDLSSTTLSSVEKITTSNTTGTTFTLDGDGVGVTLTGGSGQDTFTFVSGYTQNQSTDLLLQKTVTTITGFSGSGDIIDVSALTNGTGTFQAQATSQAAITTAHATTLSGMLDAVGAMNDGSSAAVVTAFKFGADTYVFVDNSDTTGLNSADVVIKLAGTVSTTSSDFTL